MATSDNFEGTIQQIALAGGATTGSIHFETTTRIATLAMSTATSGNSFVGKCQGLVRNAPVASAAAIKAGMPLTWSTANTNFAPVVTGTTAIVHAYANGAIAISSVLGDVILCLPTAVVLP